MTLSPRFLPALAVLLAAALVPTLIHSYSDDMHVDGRTTAAVPHVLLAYRSAPSDRVANWGQRRFGSFDWMEREYRDGDDEVRLTVVRSYDLKALYHHPELAVAYGGRFGSSFERREVMRPDVRPELPVHVLFPSPGRSAVGLYVLEYDGDYVEHPLWFQLRTAGELLFGRRKAMTLFFAHDLGVPEGAAIEHLPSLQLLFAAIDAFAVQSPDPPPSNP